MVFESGVLPGEDPVGVFPKGGDVVLREVVTVCDYKQISMLVCLMTLYQLEQ
jgi:hypothetical protein